MTQLRTDPWVTQRMAPDVRQGGGGPGPDHWAPSPPCTPATRGTENCL